MAPKKARQGTAIAAAQRQRVAAARAQQAQRQRAWADRQNRLSRHEPVDTSSLHANCFVTLRVSSQRLASLGHPQSWKIYPRTDPKWHPGSAVDDQQSPDYQDDQRGTTSHCLNDQGPAPGGNEQLVDTYQRSAFQGQTEECASVELKPLAKGLPDQLQPHLAIMADSYKQRSSDPAQAQAQYPKSTERALKKVAEDLFQMQQQVQGFVPETQTILINQMTELAQSLAALRNNTSPTVSPDNPIHQTHIAPEIIDYVDDGRNPDIYTRDFVELVQRGNAVMNGKQKAFRDFSQVFAAALKENISDISDDVNRIMARAQDNDPAAQPKSPRGNGA